ncbi:hypothetical protein [Oscillatoria sp. FACHB-1406]|uniref:hypothetical protein n=1 Tax=Oscillatoria sp. FACHB-1406 TaxID=2692846 RepID=UPI001682759C|nr:hypothetical protein [Oscillatoria sp. FACHB-1406]MBD2580040.1 hypothetical protein [Oscillatoria sp. FACHB-1406]
MSHFNGKSLAFYGIAIGSVVVLFNAVTAYGETHLTAPPSLGGRYRLQIENLPNCLQKEPKILLVEQSGVYLHGLLLAEQGNLSPEALAEEKPTLSGKWQGKELQLSGAAPLVGSCDAVTLKATLQGKNLNGTVRFGSSADAIAFASEKETVKPKAAQGH